MWFVEIQSFALEFGLEIELERFIDIGMVVLQDEADNEYEAEQEVADEFDSDFNDDVGASPAFLLYTLLIVGWLVGCRHCVNPRNCLSI